MYKVRVLCGAAILAACLAPAAHADEWTKLTYFTFSAPVEMPGMVLPAGSYKFTVAASNGGTAVQATALTFAQVAAVKQGASGVTLELASGQSIALSDVRMFL